MEEIIFAFDSITYANKAKKLLLRVGITTKLTKISSKSSSEGCVFGISIKREDYYSAVRILREADIRYAVRKV